MAFFRQCPICRANRTSSAQYFTCLFPLANAHQSFSKFLPLGQSPCSQIGPSKTYGPCLSMTSIIFRADSSVAAKRIARLRSSED
jgi:hypothetical protein